MQCMLLCIKVYRGNLRELTTFMIIVIIEKLCFTKCVKA